MKYSQLQTDMQEAMRQKDTLRLNTLRGVVANISNAKIAQNMPKETDISDELFYSTLRSLVKQRDDSIKQYTDANRMEQADSEKMEKDILLSYLPPMMSKKEIDQIIDKFVEGVDMTQKANMKLVMKPVYDEINGRADGKDVMSLIQKRFQ